MSAVVEAALGSRVEPHELRSRLEVGDWDALSRTLGVVAQPELEALGERVPDIETILFCTADGLNLCTLGVYERDVGRLSALTSSIFSVAMALRKAAQADSAGLTVHLSAEETHTVLVSVHLPDVGDFVLGAQASDIQHAVLLVETRRTAEDLTQKLASVAR
ncbi:hypothetical protein [Phycicoccus avicenniae]|uniref:hypothetical protein n=1 Tax=Phycicoccus avicenniae TaxID=2828860 RepID=UPI003D273075